MTEVQDVARENVFAGCTSMKEVLGQLAGAASMCWEHVDRAGVFQSEQASDFVGQAIERLTMLQQSTELLGL